MSVFRDIHDLFRANLPVVGLQAPAVKRLGVLANISGQVTSGKLQFPLFYWSLARGFEEVALSIDGIGMLRPVNPDSDFGKTYSLEDSKKSGADLANPACRVNPSEALIRIQKCPFDAVFVLYEAGFVEDVNFVAQLDRLWDSLVIGETLFWPKVRATKRVVLMGEAVRLPQALQRHYRIFDVPMPSQAEIEAMVRSGIQATIRKDGENQLTEDEFQELCSNCRALPTEEIYNLLRLAYVRQGCYNSHVVHMVQAERLRQLRLLQADFDNPPENPIEGYDRLKTWVSMRLGSTLRLKQKAKFKVPIPKGIVLVGPQGCGKSVLSLVIAAELGLPCINLSVGKLLDKFQGASEANLRRILDIAEAIAPCILRLDELDKAGLSGSGELDGGTTQRILGHLLTWMAQDREQPVFIVATMNRLGQGLPPEFTRKGRFDEIFWVGLPTRSERAAILKLHLKAFINQTTEAAIEKISDQAQGFSGAEIKQLAINAFYFALQRNGEEPIIKDRDLMQALSPDGQKFVPDSVRHSEAIREMKKMATGAINASLEEEEPEESWGSHAVANIEVL